MDVARLVPSGKPLFLSTSSQVPDLQLREWHESKSARSKIQASYVRGEWGSSTEGHVIAVGDACRYKQTEWMLASCGSQADSASNFRLHCVVDVRKARGMKSTSVTWYYITDKTVKERCVLGCAPRTSGAWILAPPEVAIERQGAIPFTEGAFDQLNVWHNGEPQFKAEHTAAESPCFYFYSFVVLVRFVHAKGCLLDITCSGTVPLSRD